jgi:hypothetical protein
LRLLSLNEVVLKYFSVPKPSSDISSIDVLPQLPQTISPEGWQKVEEDPVGNRVL